MAGLLKGFLYLMGVLWVVVGTLMVFVPDMLRKNVFGKIKKASLKNLSIVPVAVGILLFLAAGQNKHTLLVLLLGLLALIKGIYGIVATEKIAKLHAKWVRANDNVYRALGIGVILVGSIVLMGIGA